VRPSGRGSRSLTERRGSAMVRAVIVAIVRERREVSADGSCAGGRAEEVRVGSALARGRTTTTAARSSSMPPRLRSPGTSPRGQSGLPVRRSARTFCREHGNRRPRALERGNYDPTTGTFTTRDPLDGVEGSTTVSGPHHYVKNDPVNSSDPTGLTDSDCNHNPGGCTYIVEDLGLVPSLGLAAQTEARERSNNPDRLAQTKDLKEEIATSASSVGVDRNLLFAMSMNEIGGARAPGNTPSMSHRTDDILCMNWRWWNCNLGITNVGWNMFSRAWELSGGESGPLNTSTSWDLLMDAKEASFLGLVGHDGYSIRATAWALKYLHAEIDREISSDTSRYERIPESAAYLNGHRIGAGDYEYDNAGNRLLPRGNLMIVGYTTGQPTYAGNVDNMPMLEVMRFDDVHYTLGACSGARMGNPTGCPDGRHSYNTRDLTPIARTVWG